MWGQPPSAVRRAKLGAPLLAASALPNRRFQLQPIPMPELPDISAYITALEPRIVGQPLEHVRLQSAFLLRTAQPPLADAEGRVVRELRRIGKRIAIGVEDDLWLVLHLMIAGRLHWRASEAKLAGRQTLAAFDFPNGSLVLTEAGSKRRASLHVVRGEEALRSFDAGGIDVFSSDLDSFRAALTAENHTLKRALTDPRLLSGIGNAYSDEILHAAQLSPLTLTQKLKPLDWEKLFAATQHTLEFWIEQAPRRSQRRLPRKGHSLSQRHGGSWPLRRTVPKMRRQSLADSLCRQRNQLLRALPDRRQSSSRPQPVPAPGIRLAKNPGRTRSTKAPLIAADRKPIVCVATTML